MTTSRSLERRDAFTLAYITALLVIALPMWFISTMGAEPSPQPKPQGPGGSRPQGSLSSGSYCVAAQGAQDAIKRANGTFPFGWTASGSYCLRSGSTRGTR
jgi:hypothetical protein